MNQNRTKTKARPGRQPLTQPRTPIYQGQGDYVQDLKQIVASTKAAVQAAKGVVNAAKSLNNVPGKKALAKKAISRFVGLGDYHGPPVTHNSLINPTTRTTGAEFSHQGRRGTRVTESEFVGDIHTGSLVGGSTIFSNSLLEINPANASLFPWLSKFAGLYDQWEPLGIIIEFRTTSSTFNGTSQALGVVVGAVDYDPADPPYANKQEMENADYAVSTVASSSFLLGVECDPAERPVRVMYTGLPPASSSVAAKTFYDLGNFQIATQGMSASDVTVGELWIHYDIVFYKKQIPVSGPSVIEYALWDNAGLPDATSGFHSPLYNLKLREQTPGLIDYYEPSSGRLSFGRTGRFLVTIYTDLNITGTPPDLTYRLVSLTGPGYVHISNSPVYVLRAGPDRWLTIQAVVEVTSSNNVMALTDLDFAIYHPQSREISITEVAPNFSPF